MRQREIYAYLQFNHGIVSPLGLARVDQKRVALAAEVMTNWIARVLGYMSLRPGLGYIGSTNSNAKPRFLPFIFATDDTALVEFTNSTMRVWISDVPLTRVAVSTTVTNGTFAGNITGWTDGSDVGASIAWDTGNYMRLTGTGTAHAIGYQAITIAAGDQAKENALHVTIARGPVTFKLGTSLGDDSIFNEAVLDTGVHSLAFTPNTGTVYIQFISSAAYKVQVQACVIESAGIVTIASPYLLADLGNIRYDQSADLIFLSCTGYQQRKVERRGTRPGARSWSLCVYHVDDGPFLVQNLGPITITASATTGDITLTASDPLFRSGHVNGLFALTTQVAVQSASISAENTFTTGLKVTGTGAARSITVTVTGTWVAVVSLQSSPDNSTWADVPGEVWNGNVTGPYLDGLDGQTIYYRIGVKAGNYTSGTVSVSIGYTSGTLTGIARVTGFTDSKHVSAQVLTAIGTASAASAIWQEGSWSGYRGWPMAVRLHEGRLWWAGQNGVFGSISDSYYSWDMNTTGSSGPINRTIGSGPVDTINWLLSLQRLVIGAQGAEISARSSALDAPLTPTDFAVRPCSTQGSTGIQAQKIDQQGIYVDRTGIKVYALDFDLRNYLSPDYSSVDLTATVPELGLPGITRIAVQRKPDTRIHCVRSDGTVMLLIFDKTEEVQCWSNITSTGANGLIEDVVVLPSSGGSTEDQVYYAVNRTINGSSVRYLEKWAKETECRGGAQNKQADAFIIGTNSPASATITGLGVHEGQSVIVWADSIDYSPGFGSAQTTYTVSGGSITLPSTVTNWVVGLPYAAPWQSAKTGLEQSIAQTTLNQQKRMSHLGVVAAYFHPRGIQFGNDFDNLNDLPSIERGAPVSYDSLRVAYDEQEFPFPGVWDTDTRLCLLGQAPRPVTLMAAVADLEIHG